MHDLKIRRRIFVYNHRPGNAGTENTGFHPDEVLYVVDKTPGASFHSGVPLCEEDGNCGCGYGKFPSSVLEP